MRWSIIRIIWLRELRDQLRDRRTVFMIAVLPVLLYPVAGLGVLQLFRGFLGQTIVVGVAGVDELQPWPPSPAPVSPSLVASWVACPPPPPGSPAGGLAHAAAATALSLAHPRPAAAASAASWLAWTPGGLERFTAAAALAQARPPWDYPALVEVRDGRIVFAERYLTSALSGPPVLVPLEEPVPESDEAEVLIEPYRGWLRDRKVDLILLVPPGLRARLETGGQPEVWVYTREKDETSRLASLRVGGILSRWRRDLKEVRLARQGLPADFDVPLVIRDPERERPSALQEENLFNVLVRVFPFVLVMWSLAGALYPAVDLCAGEKERGTMETLLISPASREEIVYGKFLTIWLFSAATALLNLVSMGLTTWPLRAAGAGGAVRPGALVWGVLLLLPLSAFFSALCLAVGAYARSSKEGQYYLMPLFLLTMPLIFLTLAPGVELNPFYSMVPVTGVALLLQKLMAGTSDRGLWLYFVPVLAPMVIYGWLALRWAVEQFQREDVLFREAERLDLGLWLRRLLREKEALPSAGEALFCFALILGLRWLSFGFGQRLSLLAQTGIAQLAFVATPPLFMALLLTTRPTRGLGLTLPPWWAWPAAALLALLALPPLAELTLAILRQFPGLRTLLEQNHPLTGELRTLASGHPAAYFLVLGLLPAVCEELAFRGLILQGLLRGFRPWPAILLSAFLFAVYQMNVFQAVPHFLFGVVLGLLVVRTGSVLPAMLFHLIHNSLVIAPAVLPGQFTLLERLAPTGDTAPEWTVLRVAISAVCAALASVGLLAVWRLGRRETAEGVSS